MTELARFFYRTFRCILSLKKRVKFAEMSVSSWVVCPFFRPPVLCQKVEIFSSLLEESPGKFWHGGDEGVQDNPLGGVPQIL